MKLQGASLFVLDNWVFQDFQVFSRCTMGIFEFKVQLKKKKFKKLTQ